MDFIAKRYGRLPSDLKDLDVTDFQFNLLVAMIGVESEAKIVDKQMKSMKAPRGKNV